MPFTIPSMDRLRDLIVAVGKNLFRRSNFGSRRSYHGRKATFLSASVSSLHAHVDSAQRDVHPLTAGDGKPINDWGEATGTGRKAATPARKANAARVRGSAGAVLPAESRLRYEAAGLLFETTTNGTVPGVAGVDPDSFTDVGIAGIDTGSQTRLDAGVVLNLLSPPVGIQTQVVLQLAMDEDGVDNEPFGQYRVRVLNTFSQPSSGGNQADFVRWTLASLPQVAAAFAYPERNGIGTIDVVGFYNGTGAARALTDDDRAAVKLYIQRGNRPDLAPFHISGEGGGLRVLETIPDPRPIEIRVTASGSDPFAFDWDDTGSPTVLSWNGTTRELRFSTTLPVSLRAGHGLVLGGVATLQDGAPQKIEAISGSDKVILERAPVVAPAATDAIYSSGPLVAPIRNAILGHVSGKTVYAGRGRIPLSSDDVQPTNRTGPSVVGLDILADGIGSANPAGIYGGWSGAILRETLATICMYKLGVRNAVIVQPAADYEAEDDAFPVNDQIHYVTALSVLIRRG